MAQEFLLNDKDLEYIDKIIEKHTNNPLMDRNYDEEAGYSIEEPSVSGTLRNAATEIREYIRTKEQKDVSKHKKD